MTEQPNPRDMRLAAAVIKSHRRGAADDVAAICSDPETIPRGSQLLAAVLHVHRVYIASTRTPAGIDALGLWVQAMAGAEGSEDVTAACRLVDAHGRGDLAEVNRILGQARSRDRATHLFRAVLDLFEYVVPDLSSPPGFTFLDAVVGVALAEEDDQ